MSVESDLTARVAEHYYRYARAVDDGDVGAIDALVADDVRVLRAGDEFVGRAAVLALYRAHRDARPDPGAALTHHVVSNVQAHLAADGVVLASAYVTVTMIDADGSVGLLIGRYDDRLSDVDGVLLLRYKRVDVRREVQLEATVRAFTGVAVKQGRAS